MLIFFPIIRQFRIFFFFLLLIILLFTALSTIQSRHKNWDHFAYNSQISIVFCYLRVALKLRYHFFSNSYSLPSFLCSSLISLLEMSNSSWAWDTDQFNRRDLCKIPSCLFQKLWITFIEIWFSFHSYCCLQLDTSFRQEHYLLPWVRRMSTSKYKARYRGYRDFSYRRKANIALLCKKR